MMSEESLFNSFWLAAAEKNNDRVGDTRLLLTQNNVTSYLLAEVRS